MQRSAKNDGQGTNPGAAQGGGVDAFPKATSPESRCPFQRIGRLQGDVEIRVDMHRLLSTLRSHDCELDWVEGVNVDAEGATYTGFVDPRGQPHGLGCVYAEGSFSFTGMFSRGRREGPGVLEGLLDGEVYAGLWQGGRRHEAGVLRWRDQSAYIGRFLKGGIHGAGTLVRCMRLHAAGRAAAAQVSSSGWRDAEFGTAEGYWTCGSMAGVVVDGVVQESEDGTREAVLRLGARWLECPLEGLLSFEHHQHRRAAADIARRQGVRAEDAGGEDSEPATLLRPHVGSAEVVRMCEAVEAARTLAVEMEASACAVAGSFLRVLEAATVGGSRGARVAFAGKLEAMALPHKAQLACARAMHSSAGVERPSVVGGGDEAVAFLLLEDEWADVASDQYLRNILCRRIVTAVSAALVVHSARIYVSDIVSHSFLSSTRGTATLCPKAIIRILPCPFKEKPSSFEILDSLLRVSSDSSSPLSQELGVVRATSPGQDATLHPFAFHKGLHVSHTPAHASIHNSTPNTRGLGGVGMSAGRDAFEEEVMGEITEMQMVLRDLAVQTSTSKLGAQL